MIKKEDREIFEKVTKNIKLQEAIFSGIITESDLKKYDLLLETKIYMVHWEECIKDYKSKYKRNVSKYITLQDLLKPRNIIQILYRNTILHYIETKQTCFYCDAETANDFDKYIMYNALNDHLNFNYTQTYKPHEIEVLENYCQRMSIKLPTAKQLDSEERHFLSCSEIYAKWAVIYFVEESFSFIKYLQSLNHPVQIDTTVIMNNIKKAFKLEDESYLVRVNEDGHNNRIMIRWQYNQLLDIRHLLSRLMERNAIKLYTGLGGTGKSYDALVYAKSISDLWTCITLSNTVALKLSTDAKNRDFNCMPQSIASYNCGVLKKKSGIQFCNIIIDEFSQWSLNELGTFHNILLEVFALNGNLILLGDMHQIPSFLGRGNLLYPVQCYLENTKHHVHKAEIVRQRDQQFKECIMNYVETGDISAFNRFRIENIEDYVDPMYTMFITGSQYNVEKLNLWALSCILKEYDIKHVTPLTVEKKTKKHIIYKYGDEELTDDNWKKISAIKLNILKECVSRKVYIKAISKETWVTNKDEYKRATGLKMYDHKILTNDKAEVISFDYNQISIKLDRLDSQGKPICLDVTAGDFFDKFDFGYAINVNKSQGLDWDNVVVHLDFAHDYGCDGNAKNYEAFYVAATRGKLKTVFYIKGDENLQPFEPQVVANHFNIKESDKKVKSNI